MKRDDLITALAEFGYPLFVSGEHRHSAKKAAQVLEDLASHVDPRFMEGFPVVLANCAKEGVKMDWKALLSRRPPKDETRQNMEKLLLVSSALLEQEGLEQPEGLKDVADSMKEDHGDLLSQESLTLGGGVSLSRNRLLNTLKRYAADLKEKESARERETRRQARSFELHLHLSALFSPKQKELVLKKLAGEPLTKTEREYYSRVVKKKLEALTNAELQRIAAVLTGR